MTDDDPGELHGELQGEIRTVLTDVLEKGPEDVGASWLACAEAGLLGLAAPAEYGGEGLGLAELGVLVREAGARALDLPFRETLVCGLLTLVRCGTPEQQELFVPRIAAGELLVAPAVNEVGHGAPGATLDPARGRPAHRTQDRGPGVRRAPGRHHAPDGHRLRRIRRSGRRARRPGERWRRTHAPRRAPAGREATYEFDGAPVLGVLADGAVDVLRQHVVAGAAAAG